MASFSTAWLKLAILAAFTLTGCTSVSEQAGIDQVSDSFDLNDPYAGIDFPIKDLVALELGFSASDVSGALLDLKGAVVSSCIETAGFEPLPDEIPSRSILSGSPPKLFGGAAENGLLTLEQIPAAEASQRSPAIEESPAASATRASVIESCYAQARDVPNPLAELNDYLTELTSNIEDRVAADDRVVEAEEHYVVCFHEIGLDKANEGEFVNWFVERSNKILDDRINLLISQDAARNALIALSKEEASLESVVGGCFYSRDRVVAIVRSELEHQLIETDGPSIREQLGQTKIRLMDELGDYLR